jgi:hemolysin-activating ACP:hemolysin acyltransferase
MNFSYSTITGQAAESTKRQYEIVGAACQLAALSASHRGVSIRGFIDSLRMPINLGQVRVFHNDFGQCMGYVTWARVAEEVHHRLVSDPMAKLHEFEWNEGDRLWIMDLLVPKGSIRPVLATFRDQLFQDAEEICYFRFKRGLRICRSVARDQRLSFFKHVCATAKQRVE